MLVDFLLSIEILKANFTNVDIKVTKHKFATFCLENNQQCTESKPVLVYRSKGK